MQILYRFLYFLLGFGLCSLTHFLGVREEAYKATKITRSEVKTLVKPAQVVYRDKFRTVKLKCPSLFTQFSQNEVIAPSTQKKFSFKINAFLPISPNFSVSTNTNIGIGVFVFDKMSLDVQTPINFDTISIGVSLYF